jgi:hypothetical protein
LSQIFLRSHCLWLLASIGIKSLSKIMVAKGHLNLVKYVSCYELAVNDMIVCCSPALPPSLAKILMIVILIIIYGSVFENTHYQY